MNLDDLKKRYLKGDNISFEITNHKRIPNVVKLNTCVIGVASLRTIVAFKKWKKNHEK